MDEAVDVGALHLDDDVLARAQPGTVHLGDRGGGDGSDIEGLEHLAERSPEIGLDGRPDDVERLRRHLVAAALELVDELGWEQALTRRDDLAELDERRSERLGGAAQST